MARDVSDSTPIASKAELIGWIAEGEKPRSAFRLGTEHEKFPFYLSDRAPVPYEGRAGAGGIRHILEGMQARLGWEPIMDDGHIIGLGGPDGGGAISLEPGGQFELSGAPVENLHETAAELGQHLADVNAIAGQHGIGFVSLGHSPLWTRAQTPVMPKGRYKIMANYMPKVGTRGLDMMFRTCTVQVNLDFGSEADMVRKLRVSLALQPVATALFAASPFTEGQLNGFQSMRSEIWRDTDKARSGMLAFAFDEGMSYEAYADWALDVPMYFVKRGPIYHDVAGASFRDLLAGKLKQLPGEEATMSDWANHLSTMFPEVRLKRFLEMRGADAGPEGMLNALPAFWVGLLYDQTALDAAWDLVKGWNASERQGLRDCVPKLGLQASIAGRPLAEVAREVLALSRAGLARRTRRDAAGRDETLYLDPVMEIAERGQPLALDLADRFRTNWNGRIEPVFTEFAV
ncbi:glutamate--cysteine ligase [Bosea caraganae]|uniref:Glutamate--cysteine ligase n=1 Tax=Bosea caraganae TaxID=2763117 RepID=A0A370L4N0_9HYPH|nr:glutamate--cysteine ligase [Bosea caraganae]RDJ23655.1 glutamate--cysteine ligase [Bosea caraganae]RDJ24471.1 glutamate--cysteine ligase [Bosea caraganae]